MLYIVWIRKGTLGKRNEHESESQPEECRVCSHKGLHGWIDGWLLNVLLEGRSLTACLL